jgi:hypothetical protein
MKKIILCYNNNVYKYNDCAEILSHELIHAYDYCRANIDIENNYHIACSEVKNDYLDFHIEDKEDVAILFSVYFLDVKNY